MRVLESYVVEIDNAIFQVLESLEVRKLSKWPLKSFGFSFWKILVRYRRMDIASLTLCTVCVIFVHFTI